MTIVIGARRCGWDPQRAVDGFIVFLCSSGHLTVCDTRAVVSGNMSRRDSQFLLKGKRKEKCKRRRREREVESQQKENPLTYHEEIAIER
jgi:hypothetical protein